MSRPVELDSRNPLQHCCAALEVSRLPVVALSCLPLDPGGHRRSVVASFTWLQQLALCSAAVALQPCSEAVGPGPAL